MAFLSKLHYMYATLLKGLFYIVRFLNHHGQHLLSMEPSKAEGNYSHFQIFNMRSLMLFSFILNGLYMVFQGLGI